LEDPGVYQPGSTFDPRVAELAQKILREKSGQPQENPVLSKKVESTSTSLVDQIQAIQKLREIKQAQLRKLREELLALDNQLQTLEAKQRRASVLRRASSWPGNGTQVPPSLLV